MTMPASPQAPLHVQAVLTATGQTLGALFHEAPAIEPPRLNPAQSPAGTEVCVMVGITGDVKGQILLGMSRRVARDLAGALLGARQAVIDELVRSAIAEIANIAAGGCATELHGHGLNANITAPTVIVGDHIQVSWPDLPILESRVRLSLGELTLAVGLTPVPEGIRLAPLPDGIGLAPVPEGIEHDLHRGQAGA
jgi:chemotaxis protein CheX